MSRFSYKFIIYNFFFSFYSQSILYSLKKNPINIEILQTKYFKDVVSLILYFDRY